MNQQNPIDWIRAELLSRRGKNPRYSLRAFARHLGVSPGRLADVLNGRREITLSLARRFCEHMRFSAERAQIYIDLVANWREGRLRSLRLSALLRRVATEGDPEESEAVEILVPIDPNRVRFAGLLLKAFSEILKESAGSSETSDHAIVLRLKSEEEAKNPNR